MAKVKGPLWSVGARGIFGGQLVMRAGRAGTRASIRGIGAAAKRRQASNEQRLRRQWYQQVSREWRQLPAAEREVWAERARASGKLVTGYNLFLGQRLAEFELPPPPVPPRVVTIKVQADAYPGDILIDLYTAAGDRLFREWLWRLPRYALYEHEILLDPGDYDFRIYDFYGDGICCSWGEGYYEVTDETGKVHASGGQFYYQEITSFRVG